MTFLQKNHRLLFYFLWILLGSMQAALTELQDDEAYYWVFSKFPDWGYFDHPPLIAILIKAGYALFPNELGVRLFPFLLHVLTLLIINALTGNKNPRLFYTIALSLAFLQLSGFLAVPDTALIFSTAVFFYCYKRFLLSKELPTAIFLGLAGALLLYSKYHGALVIFFVIISNFQLLKNPRFYLAGTIALLLFLPHLLWQHNHGWMSFRYHLFESNVNDYEAGFTLSYIAGQFLLAGPVAGLILLPAALLYKSKGKFEKSLRFTLLGFYLFFLLSSFRGKVELNWTSPILVPLFILSFLHLGTESRWRGILIKLLPVTLILVIAARVIMITDLLPIKAIQERYHAWKGWPGIMNQRTGGSPVVFSNSYQRASKYWFYTGQVSFSQNLYKEHRNQYNFWPVEDSLLGKEVYYMDIYDLWKFRDSLETPLGWIGYRREYPFRSFSRLRVVPEKNKYSVNENDSIAVQAIVSMPRSYTDFLIEDSGLNGKLLLAVFDHKGWLMDIETGLQLKDLIAGKIRLSVVNPLVKGNYQLMPAASVEGYHPTHAGPRFELRVE